MRIGSGELSYQWIEGWAKIPETKAANTGWSHHGVVVTEAGEVIGFHQSDGTMLVFDKSGNLLRSWATGLAEAHGITLVKEGAAEYLWLADNGRKRQAQQGYIYPPSAGPVCGQAVKTTLKGEVVMKLSPPGLEIYRRGNYMPTSVAVNEERRGGNGDIWVADGYGQSYIHRYNKNGERLSSINGEEGAAGRFNCPHGIFIDRRKGEPELYVADRANDRVQVYDLEGKYKRAFGSEFLTRPCGFAAYGDSLFIPELRARVAVVGIHDQLVGYVGENEAVCEAEGWPNNKNEKGDIIPTRLLETGKFNSPHGMAVDQDGNLYVAEWLIGGRLTKLVKLSP